MLPDENICMFPFEPLIKDKLSLPKKYWSVTTSNVLGFVLNFKYLSDHYNLAEWTYSMRNFGEMDETGLVMSLDRIGGETKIYTRTKVNADAMTVDYHCAWDQCDKLWMIYLMRVK